MTFEELAKSKPTIEWKQRMDEDDDIFNLENIGETNKVLDSYIQNIKQLGDKPTEESVMRCVEEVVIGLNELNDKYDYFIETVEREELQEYITKAAQIAGLETDEDVTEDWREW